MLKRALEKARRGDDKKVNINFQVPSFVKDEFEMVCKESGVSVTAMLNSLIEVAIEESRGIEINDLDTMKLLDELNRSKQDLTKANEMINNGDYIVTATNGIDIDFRIEAQIASAKIAAITAEFNKRGKQ
jgi:hypothetical protein